MLHLYCVVLFQQLLQHSTFDHEQRTNQQTGYWDSERLGILGSVYEYLHGVHYSIKPVLLNWIQNKINWIAPVIFVEIMKILAKSTNEISIRRLTQFYLPRNQRTPKSSFPLLFLGTSINLKPGPDFVNHPWRLWF